MKSYEISIYLLKKKNFNILFELQSFKLRFLLCIIFKNILYIIFVF